MTTSILTLSQARGELSEPPCKKELAGFEDETAYRQNRTETIKIGLNVFRWLREKEFHAHQAFLFSCRSRANPVRYDNLSFNDMRP